VYRAVALLSFPRAERRTAMIEQGKTMKHTKAILFAGAILALGIAGQASAQRAAPRCNPPRPNLAYAVWRSDCEGVLQARWRDANPYRLPYTEYVRMIWQMYDVQYNPDRYPGLPGSRCSPEGSGYMNPSGYPQICRQGRWRIGG
jgi:hypothetical protein